MRFDKYLCDLYPEVTRSQIVAAIKRGDFTVNGQVVKAGYDLRETDKVEGKLQPVSVTAEPEDIALDIVYEDENIIVDGYYPNLKDYNEIEEVTKDLEGEDVNKRIVSLLSSKTPYAEYGEIAEIDFSSVPFFLF